MTTQINFKVRVVKCPKCSNYLPERAEVPVYQCGGCGAVLKAKIRKTESRDMELHQPDSVKESRAIQYQGSNGLSHEQTGDSSFRESVLDKSNEDRKSEDHSSTDHENSVNTMSSTPVEATFPPDPGNTSLSAEPGEATSLAEPGEATDEARSSAELYEPTSSPKKGKATSSTEYGDRGEATSSAELDEATSSAEPDEATSSAEPDEATSSAEPDEALTSAEPNETRSSAEPDEATPSAELDEATSSAEPDEAITSAELDETRSSAETDEAMSSAETDEARSSAELDESTSSPEKGKATSSTKFDNQGEATSSAETDEAMSSAELDESTSSSEKGKATSSTEFGNQGEDTSSAELNEAKSSVEPKEATSSAEPSYENESSSLLPAIHIEEKKSKSLEQSDQSELEDDTESDEDPKTHPMSKSSSEDSLINSTRIHSFATAQRSFAGSIMTDIDYTPPMEEVLQGPNHPFERISSTETFENLAHGSPEMDPRFMLDDISKSLATKSHYAYYGSESSCNEYEYRAQPRHFHPPKRIFKDKDEFSGPVRHVPRAPLYPRGDQAGTSTYGHSKFEYDSMYKRDLPESSKVELLKMVCDLQDQLDRKYNQPFRYNQVENRPSQPFPANRNAFSSEASHFRHQPDCSCLRCIPQEQRRYSSQLTRHHTSPQNPSYFLSPVHYSGSEYTSWSRESNQRQHADRDFRRVNISEKRRHCRPVAGGSPIIACYKCSSLLQIPADFLVFNKRFHLLRCHNHECSEVLKFSVLDGVHLVRYTPPDAETSLAPPPSEVDEYNNIKNAESVTSKLRKLHLASDSRVSEQISSSVDYSRSSTDGEFQTTVDSFEPVKEGNGKSVMNEKSKSRKNGPALHRLMGYASPSKVWGANMNEI